MEIRAARPDDAPAIAAIYNAGIRERTSTFETRERTPAEIRDRIAAGRHPFLVAEEDGHVRGWAAASEYSGRDVYAGVAECSVYVDARLRGRGIGTALLAALAEESGLRGFHKLIGRLFATNEASMRLVERGGFRVVGTHLRHGTLEGEWRDVILVERSLAGQPTMGYAAAMSDSVTRRTEREDFQATSDPALMESADRGEVNLLSYAQLYDLWERQQWATQDIDFTQDRIDWHERIPDEERFQRMYGLSSFFIGEQKVAEELGPMMRAAPTEEMRIFLCTQIADEARHVRFFNRFYEEVGVLQADSLQGRLAETSEHVNPEFNELFDEMLKSRVDHLARQPEDLEKLVEAVTLYHMVIEGMLALTGQHFILQYNEEQGTLPGFVEGFNNIARDEHRHVAFGARFLREMAQTDSRYAEAITRVLGEVAPIADAVLRPHWYVEGETELFGTDLEETRAFAAKALERRLKVIGLAPVA